MTEQRDDLDLKHLFRVVFLQGGQVAIGTAIGAGVLLLVGIVGILLSPILMPVFVGLYSRAEKKRGTDMPDARLLTPTPEAGDPTPDA